MQADKPLSVDLIEENAITQIFPCSPLISSHKAAWNGIIVEHHRQPAWETPEHYRKFWV